MKMSFDSETPRIEDLGFLFDRRAAIAVSPNGDLVWGGPEAHQPSMFSGLLGGPGHFRVAPVGVELSTSFGYVPGTNVLKTIWSTPTGDLEVEDALVWSLEEGAGQVLVRTLTCTRGSVEITVSLEPVFDYGRTRVPWTSFRRKANLNRAVAKWNGLEVTLASDAPIGCTESFAEARFTLNKGEGTFVALSWGPDRPPESLVEARGAVDQTIHAWREWLATGVFPDNRWKSDTVRDALTLYGLCHESGAPMAAATTSLPETPGGSRNWDYRYTWIRDASMTVARLWDLGFREPTRGFIRFIVNLPDIHRNLQIMYGLRGETQLDEVVLPHLPGYEAALPVRVGNGAYTQQQNDVWGQFIVLVHHTMVEGLDEQTWQVVISLVESALKAAHDPDCGFWEVRGDPQLFTSSRLYIWLALQRGAEIAAFWGDPGRAQRWAEQAAFIKTEILDTAVGVRGNFTIAPRNEAVDASCLLLLILGFIQPDDPGARETVEVIAKELAGLDDFLERYQPEAVDDGLRGQKEGSFFLCSFWLVQCWELIGESELAEQLLAKLMACRGRTGLYAEMIDLPTRRHLGNTPQAFSHVGAIGAVLALRAAGNGRS